MKHWWVFFVILLVPTYVEAAAELQTVEDGWLIVDSSDGIPTTQTVEDAWLIVDSADGVPTTQTVEDAWLIVDSYNGVPTTQTVEDAWLICDYSDPRLRIKVRQN